MFSLIDLRDDGCTKRENFLIIMNGLIFLDDLIFVYTPRPHKLLKIVSLDFRYFHLVMVYILNYC